MKITHITIQNFRSLEHVDLTIDSPAVALFGMNGAGKSSLINALQYALVGYCEHTDRAGKGASVLIRDGAREARITVEFETGRANRPLLGVSCVIAKKSEWQVYDPATGEVSEKVTDRAALWTFLRVPDRFHLPAMMPAAFLASGEASDVLAAFLGGDVTEQDVLDYAGSHGPFLREFAAGHHGTLDSRESLEALGKQAYEVRTLLNRDIKATTSLVEAAANIAQPVDSAGARLDVGDDAQLQREIDRAREERDGLIRQLALAEAPSAAGEAEALNKRLSTRRSNVTIQERKLAKHDETVAAATEALNGVTEAVHAAQTVCAVLGTKAQAQREALAALPDGDKKCPTCGHKMPAKEAATIRATLQAALDQALLDLSAADEALQAGRAAEAAAMAQRTYDATERDNCRRGLDALIEEVHQIEGQIESLPKPYNGPDAATLRKEIADLDARIDRDTKAIQRLKEWSELQLNKGFLEASAERLAGLNWIIVAFRDGEYVKSRSADQADSLTALVNEVLAEFGDYQVQVSIAGKRVELMLVNEGRVRPVHLCSSGQQALVQYGVAMAYATHGAPVLLDDINHLDAAMRGLLLRDLQLRATGTVIVAGAWQQTRTDWPRIQAALPDLAVYVVAGGCVTAAAATVETAAEVAA